MDQSAHPTLRSSRPLEHTMKRIGLALTLLIGLFSVFAFAFDEATSDEALQRAQQLVTDNNFNDAKPLYRQVLGDPQANEKQVLTALEGLEECRQATGDFGALDSDLALAIEVHPQSYRVFSNVADQLSNAVHFGVIADQKFTRGYDRGYGGRGGSAGTGVDVSQQDWLQAIQWRLKALELAKGADLGAQSPELGELHLKLAETILSQRGSQTAWRLTELTDLTREPNYLDLDGDTYTPMRRAPVTPAGEPLLHAVPDSWELAKSDGERLRWALNRAYAAEATKWQAKLRWGDFVSSQFSVSTLQPQFRPLRGRGAADEQDESGIFAIHTLKENESIAKLANGVRRFELPDDYNHVRIYQEVAASTAKPHNEQAARNLVNISLNRRQYPQAAERIADYLKRFSDDGRSNKQQLRDSILQPRTSFDPLPSQLAGNKAKLSLLFRNATQLKLTAQRVDMEKLLTETKNFYRQSPQSQQRGFGGQPRQPAPPLESPVSLFTDENVGKFLTGDPVEWQETLEPRDNHWDKRVELETPLTAAGLYLIEATATNGQDAGSSHKSRCLVWIQNAALVRKQLDGKVLYSFVDAATGQPIADGTLELFGYGYDRNRNQPDGNPRLLFKNLAVRLDASGQATPELDTEYQWLSIARSPDGKFGLLGFERYWQQVLPREQFEQIKAYGVSDRPMYRPGDTLKTKFWLAKATYGDEPARSLAGQQVKLVLHDAQGNRVNEQLAKTDAFGAFEFTYDLPATAGLGRYYFSLTSPDERTYYQTELAFRVEEYRKPEFEVNIAAPAKPVALGETVDARIQAKYYFGAPVVDAEVTVRVERSTYRERYYPVYPFDWCYGPGYWWFAEDYTWYPGWEQWRGCLDPSPSWIGVWWGNEPPELVLEKQLELDAQGEAVVSIDTAVAKAMYGDEDHEYTLTVEVRDASRRTITAQGKVIAAQEPFKVYTWLDRGHYRVGEQMVVNAQARQLDGTAVVASGQLDLLRIEYDAEGNPSERSVATVDVATDDEGRVRHVLAADQAGQYRVRLRLNDGQDHEVDGAYIVTIRGEGTSGEDFRYNGLELIPDKAHYAPGETVQLQVAADRSDALVYLFVRPEGGVCPPPQLVRLTDKSKIVELAVTNADQPNFFVEAFTVYDGQLHKAMREIFVPPAKRVLDVAVTTDKTEYLPGEQATVELTVRDAEGKPVEGSCVIAAYDRSLEQIAGDVLPTDIREFFWKWQRSHSLAVTTNLDHQSLPIYKIKDVPNYEPLGIFGSSLADDLDAYEGKPQLPGELQALRRRGIGQQGGYGDVAMMRGGPGMGGMGGMGAAMMADGAVAESAMMAAPMSKSANFSAELGGENAGQAAQPTVRKDFADSALWLASITTDAAGKATAQFKMPENLTSWQLRSWAVGSGTRVGSATTQAVTRKPLLVRLQTPRFLVERDEVVISAIVHNDLPTDQQVAVRLEVDGQTQFELLSGTEAQQTVNIARGEQARVDWRCRALAEGTVTLRTIAIAGDASDAMQLELPIVVNGFLKTDSYAGTVRRGTDKSTVTVTIPAERRVEQSRLTIRLSPSLAAAMIDALPYLVAYPYESTDVTLNRFLPTVMTQRVLQEMNIDLAKLANTRRNNLNAQELGDPQERRQRWKQFDSEAVFDAEVVDAMVASGVQRLTDMQLSDGGWGWFRGPLETSGAHTTALVVRGLLIAQQNEVAIVPDVLQRGVDWLDQYQSVELEKLKRGEDAEPAERKEFPSNLDALVFHTLVLAGRSNAEMQQILYDRREKLSVYGKALLAWATHQLGEVEQTAMLRRNIEQFLIEDPENETAFIKDDSPWWFWYGSEVEANAIYLKLLAAQDPQGVTAPRVVKYLLNNRKHATYWNSTRDTALVVEAFADYIRASGETKQSMQAEVWLGGRRVAQVAFTPENMFEVKNTIELSGNAVPTGSQELEIRRQGEGNLYWSAYSTNFTLQAEIEPAGLEVKIERRYYLLEPESKELTLPGADANAISTQRAGMKRTAIEDLTAVPSGSLVEVELLVQSKNDYEYLLIEDRKPAGLESVETQSGYFYNAGLGIYRELRDQHIGMCIRYLPKGNYSIRYQLRSEAPGTYTGLPATIEGMYAPELIGNSADFDMKVID
jgi:alpha-2-macroglobulin